MHEMSLCMSLVALIGGEQKSNGFAEVKRVIVEIGKLGHVDPDALRFSFGAAAAGTVADGAALEIVETDGRAWCMDCAQTVSLLRRGDGCPNCGGSKLVVEQGEELKLKELEVA